MHRPSLPVLALLLTGCTGLTSFVPLEDTGGDDTGPVVKLQLDLEALDVTDGPTSGDTQVRITLSPVDESLEVRFGDEIAPIVGTGVDYADVLTPSAADPGEVDVFASTDTHEGALAEAFRYWESGAGGRTGTFGRFERIESVGTYAWPGQAGGAQPGPVTALFVGLTQPSDSDLWAPWADTLDSCAASPDGPDLRPYGTSLNTLTFRRPGATAIVLRVNTGDADRDSFGTTEALARSWAAGATFDLEADGNTEVPAFLLEDAIETPQAFAVTRPNLNTNTQYPRIGDGFDLAWTGSPAAFVALELERLSPDGAVLSTVTCAAQDDGSFTVPAGTLSDASSGDVVRVRVGRAVQATGLLPYNDARTGILGIFWVQGLAQVE